MLAGGFRCGRLVLFVPMISRERSKERIARAEMALPGTQVSGLKEQNIWYLFEGEETNDTRRWWWCCGCNEESNQKLLGFCAFFVKNRGMVTGSIIIFYPLILNRRKGTLSRELVCKKRD